MGMTASDIIKSLGGPAQVAKATGTPLTTVIGWRDKGNIPHWRRPRIAELAAERGVALPEGFVQ